MKIANVEAIEVRAQLREPIGASKRWIGERSAVLVKLTLEDGTEGWGEAGVLATSPLVPVVEQLIRPSLVGRDVFEREGLIDGVADAYKEAGQRGLLYQALSGVDIAVWDATGKLLGQPIYRLLGGTPRLAVPAYASGLYYYRADSLAEMLELRCREVDRYLEAGFRAVKMKVGGLDERDDLLQVSGIRERIGGEKELMVDANQGYDRVDARRVARGLEHLDVTWFEEPLRNEDLLGLHDLRMRTSVPIAGGELDATQEAFHTILRAEALDILQPDLATAGGLTEARRIRALADAHQIPCVPHVWGTSIALAATLQFLAVTRSYGTNAASVASINGAGLELDRTENPLREDLTDLDVTVRDGLVRVPEGPGLGITVDAAAVAKYRSK